MSRILVAAALLTIAGAANAGLYQCVDAKGKRVFQQLPCAGELTQVVAPTPEEVDRHPRGSVSTIKGEDSDGIRAFLDDRAKLEEKDKKAEEPKKEEAKK